MVLKNDSQRWFQTRLISIERKKHENYIAFKLRLGALIPRSVCLSVGLSSKYNKINNKTLQNITNHYKTMKNDTDTDTNTDTNTETDTNSDTDTDTNTNAN